MNNIVLTGMPGSGKSTVGVLLAKRLGLGFVDTDLLIQQKAGRTLQEIEDADGYQALRIFEEAVLLELALERQVISTGGSAVYSRKGMANLKQGGVVVFLDIPLDEMVHRIGDHSLRGISRHPNQSLEDLFDERFRLYQSYCDLWVMASGLNHDEVCEAIVSAL